MDIPKTREMAAKLAVFPAGDTLWNHISPATRQLLERFCTMYDIPVERFANMKPWMVETTVAAVPMMKTGMVPDLGIDHHAEESKPRAKSGLSARKHWKGSSNSSPVSLTPFRKRRWWTS